MLVTRFPISQLRCFSEFCSLRDSHRILHVPRFWANHQRYWDNPEGAITQLHLKIRLVIGIRSNLYSHQDAAATNRNTEAVQQWIYSAETWLARSLAKRPPRRHGNLDPMPDHAGWPRQIFSDDGDMVWVSMGSLVHGVMQIGLHCDPKYLPTMSVFTDQTAPATVGHHLGVGYIVVVGRLDAAAHLTLTNLTRNRLQTSTTTR
ncbi:hypothetical protein VTK26DRAFT_562 [Humicola hyalothermophila]